MTLMWDLCGMSLPEIGAIFRAGITPQLRRMQGLGKEKRLAVSLTEIKKILDPFAPRYSYDWKVSRSHRQTALRCIRPLRP
jgi:hypothetical protein